MFGGMGYGQQQQQTYQQPQRQQQTYQQPQQTYQQPQQTYQQPQRQQQTYQQQTYNPYGMNMYNPYMNPYWYYSSLQKKGVHPAQSQKEKFQEKYRTAKNGASNLVDRFHKYHNEHHHEHHNHPHPHLPSRDNVKQTFDNIFHHNQATKDSTGKVLLTRPNSRLMHPQQYRTVYVPVQVPVKY